jgi:hypothetical protein
MKKRKNISLNQIVMKKTPFFSIGNYGLEKSQLQQLK